MTRARITVARLAAGAAAIVTTLALAPSPAQAAAQKNSVYNGGAYGSIGIMHLFDGNYTHGNYDQLLPENTYSDDVYPWSFTEGVYIGPGYCAILSNHSPDSAIWQTSIVLTGPRKYRLDLDWYWKVEASPRTSAGC